MNNLKTWLATSGFLTIGRLAGAGAGFLTQILLARVLSPRELGLFFALTSLAVVASIVAAGGYPGVMQRFMTRYRERQKLRLMSAFVRWTQLETVKKTASIALIFFILAAMWPLDSDTRITFVASVFLMLAMASLHIHVPIAVAERRFALAILPDSLVRPFLFLATVAVIALYGASISAGGVACIYAGLTAVVALAQFVLIFPMLAKHSPSSAAKRLKRKWRQEATPLIVVALFTTLFADIATFLAAPFLALENVASFGISIKISMLIGFVVQVSQQVALPDLALANQRRDGALRFQALTRASLLPSIITLTATLLTIAWGEVLLGLFGTAFVSAKWSLVLMTGTQFIRAVAGPNSLMLTLVGAHRVNWMICFGCSALLLISNAILIPSYGLEGAALSTGICYVAWVAATTVALWRLSHVRTDIFVLAFRPRQFDVVPSSAVRRLES